MENFRPDLMEPETVLVTQMLWGQTTHIGQLTACQSVNHAGLNLSVNLGTVVMSDNITEQCYNYTSQ